jgi:hypothetical protein
MTDQQRKNVMHDAKVSWVAASRDKSTPVRMGDFQQAILVLLQVGGIYLSMFNSKVGVSHVDT